MMNSTLFTTIILTGYLDVGKANYLCFAVLTLVYVAIVVANVLLIGVIWAEQSLHEPMYILLCCLSLNELYGSASFFPFILTNILSSSHEITIVQCYVFMFFLYTYAAVEFGSLAIMSYDRYLAICYPLLYNTVMTRNKVIVFIVLLWLVSFVKYIINMFLSLRLNLCGNVIEKVYCDNYLLVKLACSDISVNNVYGIVNSVFSVVLPLLLILYSYKKILKVCLMSSKKATQKAMGTCAPHLASLLNFSVGCSFEILSSRFDKIYMPPVLRVIVSVYFVISPPLLNPIIYGIRLAKVRNAFRKRLTVKRSRCNVFAFLKSP